MRTRSRSSIRDAALLGLVTLSVLASGVAVDVGAAGQPHSIQPPDAPDPRSPTSVDPPGTGTCPLPPPKAIPTGAKQSDAKRPTGDSTSGGDPGPEPNATLRPPVPSAIPDLGRIGPDGRVHGLPGGVVATLFSRDNESQFITDAAFAARYGWNRSSLAALANGSDLTFERPPPVARWWTTHEFPDLDPGGWNASTYPVGADLAVGRINGSPVIHDAHATVFAAQPSTVAHVANGTERLYLAPRGSLLGLVDYRVTIPPARTIRPPRNVSIPDNATVRPGTRRVRWCLQTASVRRIRLRQDGRVVATGEVAGYNATPVLNYSLQGTGATTLRLEATIAVTLRKRTDRYRCENATTADLDRSSCRWVVNGSRSIETTVEVADTVDGTVYDLDPAVSTVQYPGPNGDVGIAVFQQVPWQGYVIGADNSTGVNGVWRFYTARDTSWDVLVVSNGTATERIRSPALPVAVHAVPSKLGPTVDDRGDIRILDTWGESVPAPRGTLAETVHVGTIPDRYTPTWGLAVRTDGTPSTVTIEGIVAGVNATVRSTARDRTRRIHNTTIEAQVVAANRSAAVVEVRLRDTASGRPIVLSEPPDDLPFRDRSSATDRRGYVRVGERVVATGPDGTARVVVDQPGVYPIRYVPESWVTVDPAYAPSTMSVRWQPADEFGWWLRTGVRLLEFALPFVLVAYAARRFGRLLSCERL